MGSRANISTNHGLQSTSTTQRLDCSIVKCVFICVIFSLYYLFQFERGHSHFMYITLHFVSCTVMSKVDAYLLAQGNNWSMIGFEITPAKPSIANETRCLPLSYIQNTVISCKTCIMYIKRG